MADQGVAPVQAHVGTVAHEDSVAFSLNGLNAGAGSSGQQGAKETLEQESDLFRF